MEMPQSSLSILNMFKIYKHNFLHLFRFLEPGGAALRVQKKAWAGASKGATWSRVPNRSKSVFRVSNRSWSEFVRFWKSLGMAKLPKQRRSSTDKQFSLGLIVYSFLHPVIYYSCTAIPCKICRVWGSTIHKLGLVRYAQDGLISVFHRISLPFPASRSTMCNCYIHRSGHLITTRSISREWSVRISSEYKICSASALKSSL